MAVLASVSRLVDPILSRGEGLDARGDPFSPPIAGPDVDALLARVRGARAPEGLPFDSPPPPPGGSARVEVRTMGEGPEWALVAPHYGSLAHPARLGVLRGIVGALRRERYAVALSLGAAGLGLAAASGAPFDAFAAIAGVDNPASFYATGRDRAARRATLAAHGLGPTETAAAFAPGRGTSAS